MAVSGLRAGLALGIKVESNPNNYENINEKSGCESRGRLGLESNGIVQQT